MKWRGPDKLTFSNRVERALYIQAHPVPDTWESYSRMRLEQEHPYTTGGHKKITREHEGRPLRWCVTCHVPLFHGWYCGQPCDKKRTACRAMVYQPEHTCHLHTPEKIAERDAKYRRKKQADVQHTTSTSQVRQIEWVRGDRTKPDAEAKRRASSEMRKGRVNHW